MISAAIPTIARGRDRHYLQATVRNRGRRLPRLLLHVFPVCVTVETMTMLLTPTPAGRTIADGLAWVGRATAFLY